VTINQLATWLSEAGPPAGGARLRETHPDSPSTFPASAYSSSIKTAGVLFVHGPWNCHGSSASSVPAAARPRYVQEHHPRLLSLMAPRRTHRFAMTTLLPLRCRNTRHGKWRWSLREESEGTSPTARSLRGSESRRFPEPPFGRGGKAAPFPVCFPQKRRLCHPVRKGSRPRRGLGAMAASRRRDDPPAVEESRDCSAQRGIILPLAFSSTVLSDPVTNGDVSPVRAGGVVGSRRL